MPLLIVDGYNIINSWPELASLNKESMEGARMKLLDILANYVPYAWQKIIIVYDAYRVKGHSCSVEEYGGVQVIFTAEGQTADSYIERLVTKVIEEGNAVEVASSDFMEQNTIFWKGGQRVSARELRLRLQVLHCELLAGCLPAIGPSLLDERIPPQIKSTLEKWRRRD